MKKKTDLTLKFLTYKAVAALTALFIVPLPCHVKVVVV